MSYAICSAVILQLAACATTRSDVDDIEDDAEIAIVAPTEQRTRWRPKMTKTRSKKCLRVRRIVYRAAQAGGLDPDLMLAIAWVESGFSTTARSSVGAQGLMQLLPRVSRAFGCDQPREPACAAPAAVKLYKRLLSRFDGHDVYALCAYNAGAGRVSKAYQAGRPPFNYGYAQRVFAARVKLRRRGCAPDS